MPTAADARNPPDRKDFAPRGVTSATVAVRPVTAGRRPIFGTGPSVRIVWRVDTTGAWGCRGCALGSSCSWPFAAPRAPPTRFRSSTKASCRRRSTKSGRCSRRSEGYKALGPALGRGRPARRRHDSLALPRRRHARRRRDHRERDSRLRAADDDRDAHSEDAGRRSHSKKPGRSRGRSSRLRPSTVGKRAYASRVSATAPTKSRSRCAASSRTWQPTNHRHPSPVTSEHLRRSSVDLVAPS